ncbi:MAG: hypothetical protein AB8H80_23455 [Planctomycetota bacterium]
MRRAAVSCRLAMVACLLATAATAELLAQDGAFVVAAAPVANAARAAATTSVRLDDRCRVDLEAGELWWTSASKAGGASERRKITTTVPGGYGRVHALAVTSFGQCAVASDAGLLLLDADHSVADRFDLRDGMPEGIEDAAVLGLHADATGRLWLCTAEHFAVVDTRHRFGHTFGRADGIPSGPFTGMSHDAQGLLLHRADDTIRYRPDLGDAPRLATRDRVQADNEIRAQAPSAAIQVAAVEAKADGSVRLQPKASGANVQLRARRQHHHLIVPLDDGELRGLRPGGHVVEVFGVDRDLRRALLGRYRVHVPLPARYSTRWLPVVGLAGVALLVWLAWPRRGRRRLGRTLLRTGLVTVFGLQLLAAVLGYGRSWPFMGFSMYTGNFHEQSVLYKPLVRGCCENGRIVELGDWFLGLRQDGYWQLLADIVHGPEKRLETLLATVRQRWPQAGVEGFEFVDTRVRLTCDGPVDVAPTVLRRYRWEAK